MQVYIASFVIYVCVVSVWCVTQYGSAALDHSAMKGHSDNIRMLVETLGAKPNAFDTVSTGGEVDYWVNAADFASSIY